MRITYVKLINFSSIYSAMKKREIEIDLKKSKNRVVLLVGKNGSGKTSLLSQLHPFALPGSMDIRNGSSIILPDCDGYKEIHIKKGEDKYEIKHYYLYNSGKGVKSYISKNGKEMNPNGNVSSFKEIVLEELSLEQDYLKLIRLGPNVKNFIKMTASERKSFTSELLSEIDVYSKYYKKINEDSRVLKSLLKTVSDKIEKLHVYNEVEEYERLNEMENKLLKLNDDKNFLNNELGKIDGMLNVLIPQGLDNFIKEVNEIIKEKNDIEKNIINYSNKIKNILDFDLKDKRLDKIINKIHKEINSLENKIMSNKSMIDFIINKLNALYDRKREKEDRIKYVNTELEYSKLMDLYLYLNKRKEELSKKYNNFNTNCTKEDMLMLLSILQEIDKVVSEIYEFETKSIKQTIELILSSKNVDSFVKKNVLSIDDKISTLKSKLNAINKEKTNEGVYILYKPQDCKCECPYQKFYDDVYRNKSLNEIDKIKSEISSLEHKREMYLEMVTIKQKIDSIASIIRANKNINDKTGNKYLDLKRILHCINTYCNIYDEDEITETISLLEEYEEYLSIDNKIKDVLKEKKLLENNKENYDELNKEIVLLSNEISQSETEVNKLKEENTYLQNKLKELKEKVVKYEEAEVLIDEVEKSRQTLENLNKLIEEKKSIKDKVQELLINKKSLSDNLSKVEGEINNLSKLIDEQKYRIKEFEKLTEERKVLEEKYDDINIIKESLSSNKGIPLLFIQLYLRNTRLIVNQLLDIVFKGELEIGEFIINDKEFKIPYTKNGITIEDVSYCSQGEESFISLALSFALIEQSIKDYNILLLDEIDATLDIANRYMFLTILEKQLDSINAEQIFLITHNNMFDNYPVDLILTSDEKVDNLRNANIIYRAN